MTCVNERVTDVDPVALALRSVTVPGVDVVTVRVAEPETVSLVAVMTAGPAATAVTRPVLETVATLVLLLA